MSITGASSIEAGLPVFAGRVGLNNAAILEEISTRLFTLSNAELVSIGFPIGARENLLAAVTRLHEPKGVQIARNTRI